MSNKIIGSRDIATGEIIFHAESRNTNYHTLCSTSLDDDLYEPVEPPKEQKITCKFCFQIWKESKRFKASDFSPDRE